MADMKKHQEFLEKTLIPMGNGGYGCGPLGYSQILRKLNLFEAQAEEIKELRSILEDAYPLAIAHAATHACKAEANDYDPVHQDILNRIKAALKKETVNG